MEREAAFKVVSFYQASTRVDITFEDLSDSSRDIHLMLEKTNAVTHRFEDCPDRTANRVLWFDGKGGWKPARPAWAR